MDIRMVTAVTSLGRTGVFDFVAQRVTAVVLAAYTLFIVVYICSASELTYEAWTGLFSQLWMRIFSLLALISVAVHGWIGFWAVLTDYVTDRMMGSKAVALRAIALAVYALVTLAYLVWGVEILWGF